MTTKEKNQPLLLLEDRLSSSARGAADFADLPIEMLPLLALVFGVFMLRGDAELLRGEASSTLLGFFPLWGEALEAHFLVGVLIWWECIAAGSVELAPRVEERVAPTRECAYAGQQRVLSHEFKRAGSPIHNWPHPRFLQYREWLSILFVFIYIPSKRTQQKKNHLFYWKKKNWVKNTLQAKNYQLGRNKKGTFFVPPSHAFTLCDFGYVCVCVPEVDHNRSLFSLRMKRASMLTGLGRILGLIRD